MKKGRSPKAAAVHDMGAWSSSVSNENKEKENKKEKEIVKFCKWSLNKLTDEKKIVKSSLTALIFTLYSFFFK